MKVQNFANKVIAFILLASLLLAGIPQGSAHAATLTVCASGCGYTTIASAITAASNEDTINIQAGTYNEYALYVDKNLSFVGAGSADTTINAGALGRIFYIELGTIVNISGMTLTNGKVSDNAGGAIYNQGSLTMDDVIITNNVIAKISSDYGSGGGISNAGTLTITNSQITHNTAVGNGGGIDSYFGTTVHLTNVLIQDNVMTGPNGSGAGIAMNSDATSNSSTLILDSVMVDNNTGGNSSGGIWVQDYANVTITNSTISNNGNNSAGYGGLTISANGVLTMSNSTISDNDGGDSGGGLVIHSATADLTNVTITGNNALYGAGIYAPSGTINLNNVTIAGNSGDSAAGIYNNGATINLKNTIVADNTATSSYPDCNGTLNSQDYNLIENTSGCTINGTTTHNITGTDPMLGILTDNGGLTGTISLLPGSPAIDAGDNATCTSTDQRDYMRPLDGNKDTVYTCDIGAYEYGNRMIFTSVGSKDGWVRESTEISNAGGAKGTSAALRVGDDASDRQYKSILSFDTSGLDDTVSVQAVFLYLKQSSISGQNPVNTHGKFLVDIRKPYFGAGLSLGLDDFNQAANLASACTIGKTPVNAWYSGKFIKSANAYVNKTGTTQMRLRFGKDDNDDRGADTLNLFGGEAADANRPYLIVYYVP